MDSIKRFFADLFSPSSVSERPASNSATQPKSSDDYRKDLEQEKLRPANRGL